MSWFSEKVGNLVRDVQRQASAVGTGGGSRSADELGAELEQQARRVNGPQGAAEVLAKWAERSDICHNTFPLGASGEGSHGLAEPLSFYQALLRCQAFELLLEACSKAPTLRAELLLDKEGSAEKGPLSQILGSVAERMLLPGAHVLWPSLLEVLLAAGAAEDGAEKGGPGLDSKCRPWARRALALVKRQWQSETLPAALRCLDRKLAELVAKQPAAQAGDGQGDLLRSSSVGQRMSKNAIRAAMARDTLRRHAAEAAKLRAKTELLCDACARLEAAEGSGATAVPEVEKLMGEADDMLAALDAGVKAQLEEQENLRSSLRDVTSAIEDQIAQFQETLTSFNEKRGPLQDERAALMRRLEEINMHIAQIDETTAHYEKKARGLAGKLRETTTHYEDKIAQSYSHQKRFADEKLRAISCKECAHTVLDVVQSEEKRRRTELGTQLRKRRAELERACAAYVREERLRLEAAAECAAGQGSSGPRQDDDSSSTASTDAQEAWQAAQVLLRRAIPLLQLSVESAGPAGHPTTAAGSVGSAPERHTQEAGPTRQPVQQAAPEDALAFFARITMQGRCCVDCARPDADWASVSIGTYLCMECAGRHRGLGVHLSFVRSTTMDVWSSEQLQRMNLGGTQRFLDFLRSYPQLCEPPQTAEALATRYGSRAAAYYRRLLDVRCEGGDISSIEAPPQSEGHLPAKEGDGSGSGSACGGASSQSGSGGSAGADQTVGSFEEEKSALEATYRQHKEQLKLPSTALPTIPTRPALPQAARQAAAAPPASPAAGHGYPAAAATAAPAPVVGEVGAGPQRPLQAVAAPASASSQPLGRGDGRTPVEAAAADSVRAPATDPAPAAAAGLTASPFEDTAARAAPSSGAAAPEAAAPPSPAAEQGAPPALPSSAGPSEVAGPPEAAAGQTSSKEPAYEGAEDVFG